MPKGPEDKFLFEISEFEKPSPRNPLDEGSKKKSRRRKETDLSHKPYIPKMMEKTAAQLAENHWRVVSWGEISRRLAHSRFALLDLQKLRDGFGLWLEGPCGQCLYHLTLGGVEVKVLSCDDEQCGKLDMRLLKRVQYGGPVILGNNMILGRACLDCVAEHRSDPWLRVTRIEEGQRLNAKGKLEVQVLQEVSCPHHGLVRTKTVWYAENRIIESSKLTSRS